MGTESLKDPWGFNPIQPNFLGAVKMLHIQTEKQRIGETEDPFAASTAMLRFFIEKALFVHFEFECPISNRWTHRQKK